MSKRCTHVESNGFHRCGSYAFNLEKDGIEQGDLCDVHYWQDQALSAKAKLAEQPAPAAHQEPVASLSETQAKAILVLALDLEKTGRAVAIAEGQERTDFVARNRNIQCALEDALRNATTSQAQPAQRKPLSWIATADQMPPPGVRVFWMHQDSNRVGYDTWMGDDFRFTPSHWMPIPALQAQPAREPLTDDKYEAIVDDLSDWRRYVEVDTAHQTLEEHVRQVLTDHGITKGNT